MDLTDCLPAELRAPTTTIVPIGAGMSTATVYRVEAAGTTYVLKVARDDEPIAAWRTRLAIHRAAAAAGVAPVIVHADEDRRAVVTEYVADRGLAARFGDPRTRDASIALLGRTLRTVHDLPAPLDAEHRDPRKMLGMLQGALAAAELPAFARAAIAEMLAAEPPATDRTPTLSHNDVNPTNLVYDGARVVLVDWDTAGVHEPLYDLAAIAMFLRLDDAECRALIAAHDGTTEAEAETGTETETETGAETETETGAETGAGAGAGAETGAETETETGAETEAGAETGAEAEAEAEAEAGAETGAELPARFVYDRRFVAVMCGAAFLHLARAAGHPGDATRDGPALADFYQQLRAGAVSIGTPAGRWAFGLALMKSA